MNAAVRPAAALLEGSGAPAFEMALAVPEEQLRAWFDAAAPGHSAVYAVGAELPRSAASVKLVKGWVDAGVAQHAPQQRDPRDRTKILFKVIKGGAPKAAARTVKHAVLRPDLKRVLDALADCARRGLPCPSDRVLQSRLDLKTRKAARYLLERLEADGIITIEGRGRNLPRVVTIVATGKATRA